MKHLITAVIFFGFTVLSQAQTLKSDSIDILNYSINLDMVHLSKKSISGYTELTIAPKYNAVSQIKLDLLALDIDSIIIDNQSVIFNYNDTVIDIPLAQPIGLIDTIKVKIFYHGNPVTDPSGWGGFYFSTDSLYAFNLGVGFADNPHNYGRAFFPCIDDFHDRATYKFTIKTKIDKMAVCNGSLISTIVDSTTQQTTYHWQLNNSIPTYLVGLAVGPYVAVLDTFMGINGQVPIGIYVPANKVAAVQGSFARLHQILSAYEWAYGPYQWERVGYVAVPFNSGAMEHSTNIALGLAYINGANTYESLIAHELSHQWFGNLATTNSAPEMWINEGWAVYSENLYKELLDGKPLAKSEMRALLKDVILNAHIQDGGYWSLANLPHEATYGNHAYDKGATVAHSIRGYLGDSTFFAMLKNYFNHFAFSHVSNADFRDFISNSTSINMSGFFDAWVFQPGFVHFSVDSFNAQPIGNKYHVEVNMRQKLRHKSNLASDNRVWVRFANNQWQFADRLMEFSGITGTDTAILNFEPTIIFTDPEAKLADATTDYYQIIKTTGSQNFADSYFKLDTKNIQDSALIYITHHWVAPDTQGTNLPGLYFADKRYWSVEGIFPADFNATGQFFYSKIPELDGSILQNAMDSLVILYRQKAGMPWQSVNFTKQGVWSTGWANVENLMPGQYAIAVWDELYAKSAQAINSSNSIRLFPNPMLESTTIWVDNFNEWSLTISDIHGRILIENQGFGSSKLVISKNQFNSPGIYLISVRDKINQIIKTEKLVVF